MKEGVRRAMRLSAISSGLHAPLRTFSEHKGALAVPIERQPRKPLPIDYKPPKSIEYRVKDLDSEGRPESWITVAEEHNLDVKALIYFNFHTNHPDEVNWYLRRNVGCNVPTKDGKNWTFSASANPGKIYLPIEQFDMAPIAIKGRRTTISPLALEFDGPASPLDTIGKVFDGFQMVDIGLTLAGVAVGEGVVLIVGIAIAPLAPFVLIGGPHEAALNELRKKQILEGLSLGIVLAADERSLKYIYKHGYFKLWPVQDINYPEYGKQFQGIYNTSLIAGYGHGSQFNREAAKNLFQFLHHQLPDYLEDEFSSDPDTWDEKTWEDSYRLTAAVLTRKIKLR
jgi:hypothetical protein